MNSSISSFLIILQIEESYLPIHSAFFLKKFEILHVIKEEELFFSD